MDIFAVYGIAYCIRFNPILRMIERMHHHLSDLRRSADFMRNDVAVPAGNDFIASFCLAHEGQQVAQSAAADKQTGFLSHKRGSPLFQLLDRRVIPVHIIPDDRFRHCPAHRRRRLRDGIAA